MENSVNFISSKDAEEERVMHSNGDNIKFTSYNDTNEVVGELFNSVRSRYQDNLENSMRRNKFIFDSVQLMHRKSHRVNFRRGGSYIDSPGWVKKKTTPKNKYDKYFQFAISVALNYEEIKWNPERVSNIKPFINKYKWEGINCP